MNAPPPPRTSGHAIVSLVCGVLSWVALPVLGALVAIVAGHLARREIRRAPPGTLAGDGLALAGLVLGWVNLVLVTGVLLLAAAVLFGPLAG